MGFLTYFTRADRSRLTRLPAGSFTVDPNGHVVASTLPQSFPAAQMREIGQQVLQSFRAAQKAKLPLTEVRLQFAALKLVARELKGGAMIFLTPQSLDKSN